MFLDILTAIIGIGILSKVLIPEIRIKQKQSSVWLNMRSGIKYMSENEIIYRILFIYSVFIFLCVPAGFLAGLFVSRVFENSYDYLTFVEMAGFAGMSLGGLLMSVWGGFSRKEKTLQSGLFIFGAMTILMGIEKNFMWYLCFMFMYGIAMTVVQTVITTMLQEKTKECIQGRVFGMISSLYAGLLPIGMAIFGMMADVVSLQLIMIASGVVLITLSFSIIK